MATQAERNQAQADFEAMLTQAQMVARGQTEELIGARPVAPVTEAGQKADPVALAQFMAQKKGYDERLSTLQNNPLIPKVTEFEQLRQQEAQQSGQETADGMYDLRINELKENAMKGVDKDLVHEKERAGAGESIVQGFMRGGIIGAVMAVVRLIPGVSNAMDVPGTMMKDALAGKGSNMDPAQTYQTVTRGANLQSALMGAVGADPANASVVSAVADVVSPQKQTSPQAGSNDQQVAFDAPNGTMPGVQPVPGKGNAQDQSIIIS